mmetsp:Transcript_49319/g.139212  ORF Transcript_49319/g.139212 Transcript_49319/m.139212 type:complete len:389 (+) Transcript_49319:226-1392(+)
MEAGLQRCMLQSLHHTHVRVRVARVLPDQGDRDGVRASVQPLGDHLPVAESPLRGARRQGRGPQRQGRRDGVGGAAGPLAQAQVLADEAAGLLLRQQQGDAVEVRGVVEGDDTLRRHLAEQRELAARGPVHRLLRAAHEQVRLQASLAQQLHRVLAGFRLLLAGGAHDRHHAQVEHEEVFVPDLELELLQGLEVHGALDVADRAPELHEANLRARARGVDGLQGHLGDPVLDGVGDVRHHLHGLAQVVAHPLALDDLLVNLPRGHAVARGERQAEKPLVVAEVQVCLAAVLEDVDLPVLEGAHGPRVDVQVRVDLDGGDPDAVRPQHDADGGDRRALPEARDRAAGDDDVLHGARGRRAEGRPRPVPGVRRLAGRLRCARARHCFGPV